MNEIQKAIKIKCLQDIPSHDGEVFDDESKRVP